MTDSSRSQWIDISVPLRTGMACWPGDPPVRISRVQELARGDGCNLSELYLGSHTGTHVDAPLHFIPGGAGIDRMALDVAVGRARVIEIHDSEAIKAGELARHRIRRGERILFKTRNSSHAWQKGEFAADFVFIADDAARLLAGRGVRLVGVDYLSVGSYRNGGGDVHKTLLGGGVWIIEGLDLSQVCPGTYDLICLPIKLENGDGAPARAILRPVLGAGNQYP